MLRWPIPSFIDREAPTLDMGLRLGNINFVLKLTTTKKVSLHHGLLSIGCWHDLPPILTLEACPWRLRGSHQLSVYTSCGNYLTLTNLRSLTTRLPFNNFKAIATTKSKYNFAQPNSMYSNEIYSIIELYQQCYDEYHSLAGELETSGA